MAAVTVHSDFGAQEEEICHYFHLFPLYWSCSNRLEGMTLVFWIFSFKPALSLSSLTLIKRLFSSSLLSAIRVISSAYLRLLMFLLPILIPACAKSTLPVFYKWNNGVWMSAYLFAMWLTDTALLTKLTLLDLLLRKKDFFQNITSPWQCNWSSKSSDGDVQWD